jgi:hypothetical protein
LANELDYKGVAKQGWNQASTAEVNANIAVHW